MNKIPTAEEFIADLQKEQGEQEYIMVYKIDIPKKLIEFAKLHVQAALESVNKLDLDDVTLMPEANDFEEGRVLHILSAYPLTNIK